MFHSFYICLIIYFAEQEGVYGAKKTIKRLRSL